MGSVQPQRSTNFSTRNGMQSTFLSEYADEYVKKQSLRMKLKKGEKPRWIAGQPFDDKRASTDPHAATRKSSLHKDDFKPHPGARPGHSVQLQNLAEEKARVQANAGKVPFRTVSTYDDHLGTDKGWKPKPGFDRSKNCNTRDNYDANRPVETNFSTTLQDEFPDWKLPKPPLRSGNLNNNKLQSKFTETSEYRSHFKNDKYPRPELQGPRNQLDQPPLSQYFYTTYRDDFTRKLDESRVQAMSAAETERALAERIAQLNMQRQTWASTSPITKAPAPGTKGQFGTKVAWAGRKRGYVIHEPSKAPFSSADDRLPFSSESTYREFCMHAKPHPRQPYVQRRTRATLETMTGPDHFTK
eukprot:jgi/Tetstr1/443636/TSEL_031634.t1